MSLVQYNCLKDLVVISQRRKPEEYWPILEGKKSLYKRSWINTVSDIKVKIRIYIIHVKSNNPEDGYHNSRRNEWIYRITFQPQNRAFGTFCYTCGGS